MPSDILSPRVLFHILSFSWKSLCATTAEWNEWINKKKQQTISSNNRRSMAFKWRCRDNTSIYTHHFTEKCWLFTFAFDSLTFFSVYLSLSLSLSQSHKANVMVWCWLITLWMRYVSRIRNFSYTIEMFAQTKPHNVNHLVHMLRSFGVQSSECSLIESEYDRKANAKINQFNWKLCVLYFRLLSSVLGIYMHFPFKKSPTISY